MDHKAEILIAASIYPPDPGGPAMHAKAQFEGLPKFGIKTRLVALAHFRKWLKGIRHLVFLIQLVRRSSGVEAIYAHDALGAGFPALIASRIMRKKLLLRIGGDIAWERHAESNLTSLSMMEWYASGNYKRSSLSSLTRHVIARAEAMIVTSDLLAQVYKTYYGIPEGKIRVIPNPIPPLPEVSVRKGNTIIYASRLVAYKNLTLALKAFGAVSREHPELKFIIMGDGPEKESLELEVRSLKLDGKVELRGAVPQEIVVKETSKCLFAIAPALTEFNPNYILQAISMGKPILVSRENGFPFGIPEELTFDPRSEAELIAKMLYLLTENGYKSAEDKVGNIGFKMTWDDNLEANAGVISQLLHGLK